MNTTIENKKIVYRTKDKRGKISLPVSFAERDYQELYNYCNAADISKACLVRMAVRKFISENEAEVIITEKEKVAVKALESTLNQISL